MGLALGIIYTVSNAINSFILLNPPCSVICFPSLSLFTIKIRRWMLNYQTMFSLSLRLSNGAPLLSQV